MRPRPIRVAALAAVAVAAATLAACGGSSKPSSTSSAGKPVSGGTLRWAANGDVDHLDPLSAYYTATGILERAYTRQLVTYPATNDYSKATTIVPDVATTVPTTGNGGISSDGKTYTFHLRTDVMWNTSPPRAVTAQDFVRQFKRMCNPVLGVGNPPYYTSTIAGMQAYCGDYQKLPSTSTAAKLAAFQNSHNISGVSAPNATTLVFHLTQPASDFLNVLAMQFASAAPVEWDSYIPDSAQFRQHVYSDGPYQISGYTAGKQILMTRNPAWKQASDTVRHQYVNKIVVTEGVADPNSALQQTQAGSMDLANWDLPLPTSAIPSLQAKNDPNFSLWPGHIVNNYIVFNLRSTNTAMAKLQVRQAIEYAISKTAVSKIYGGTSIAPVVNTAIPPGNIGNNTASQNFNLYPTPGNNGDSAKCKSMLASAGYPHGLNLVYAYRNGGNHIAVYQAVQASLKACGITVKGVPIQQGNFYANIENPAWSKTHFDITEAGWVPDWYGNNGRSTVQPLFTSPCVNPTTNYGCYNSPVVNSLVQKALAAPDVSTAGNYWFQADQQVMKDAVIVPLDNLNTALYHSTRVKNAIYNWQDQVFDPTQLWLSPNSP